MTFSTSGGAQRRPLHAVVMLCSWCLAHELACLPLQSDTYVSELKHFAGILCQLLLDIRIGIA